MTLLGWNYFIHEEQRWVGDASGHLASNPNHTITERYADDLHPAGISGADYTPDDTYVYVRTDGVLHRLAVSGSNLVINTSGVDVVVGDGEYLALSGGTLTGDLLLAGDPTVDAMAATKKYVDDEIANVATNAQISVKDNDSLVNSGIGTLDFGTALDVTDQGGGEVQIVVDESEFTSVLFLSGGTMTGALTLSGSPSADLDAANKKYVDDQVAAAIEASNIEVKDDNVLVNSGTQVLDFTHALSVTDEGSNELRVDVDESEFTSVVFLTGDQTISGNKTFANNVTVNGDLTVEGTTTSINTAELYVEDNIITLNAGASGSPVVDAGIEVDRGSETNSVLYWNETADQWEAGISGAAEKIILQSDLDSAISGISGDYVNITGDTMTGALILSANATQNLQAVPLQQLNSEISTLSGYVDTQDAATLSSAQSYTDSAITTYSGFAETQFVNIAGDTMTGALVLSGAPSTGNEAVNKDYADSLAAAVQPTLQVDFTTATDLDTTQNTLPLNAGTAVNPTGTVYTVNANNISISQTGYYKVSWNVEAQKTGGASQRRILQTNLNFNGSQIASTSSAVYIRDATNNHGSTANSYVIEVTSGGQTVGIRSQQTGSGGGGGVTFDLSAGHLLIERIGDN